MKGDMYDDGTPNPLIVKCPQCGGVQTVEYIGTGSSKYRCNTCGKEFSYTYITSNDVSHSCPNCGTLMSRDYIHGTWYCTSCGCIQKENIGMSNKTEATKEQFIFEEAPKYGWVCPKCGKVYAPDVKECFTCNYNLANTKVSGQINQSSSAETHMENVTATMGTQEKRVRQDGSFVIDKSLFPGLNLAKDSTVYAGAAETNWRKAQDTKTES